MVLAGVAAVATGLVAALGGFAPASSARPHSPGELVGLLIKPEACDPEDTETLADLIVAAVRDANIQAMALAQATMPQMPNPGCKSISLAGAAKGAVDCACCE